MAGQAELRPHSDFAQRTNNRSNSFAKDLALMAVLEDLLDIRHGKGVVGKWSAAWFCLRGSSLEQYPADNGQKQGNDPVQVYNLLEVPDLTWDDARNEITFQSGKIRLRSLQGMATLQKWFQQMQQVTKPEETQAAAEAPVEKSEKQARFEPPPRDSQTSLEEKKSPASPRTRKSFAVQKAGEHVDPKLASSMSRATQALLTIFYQLDHRRACREEVFEFAAGDCVEIWDLHTLQKLSGYERYQPQLLNSKASASSQQIPNMRKTCRACRGLRCESQHHLKDSLQELDRAMKKAARGEDVLIEEEVEQILDNAMLQVDTVMHISSMNATEGMYIARARWKGDDGKGPKTDARPGSMSGPAAEDCPIRQQLKLIGKKDVNVAVLSIIGRHGSGSEEELVGTCEIDVQDPKHHEVHILPLLKEGESTGATVRLRVKLKSPEIGALRKQASQVSLARSDSHIASIGSPRQKKDPEETQKRLDLLHQLHADKQKRLEERRLREQEEYASRLQEEAQKLRSKSVKQADLCPRAAARQRRRREHQLNTYHEDEQVILRSKEARGFHGAGLRLGFEVS
ncbi:unnamed protein product [Symbiodinium sp. CCMP2592]|nr:unnamed protein product [Symbiodinium sp. CCMP2592]